MKRITLERLTLRNFKGFKEFTLQASSGAVDVYGDNATGKTTIFDAFTWMLFGKDSTNRTDFEIQELDSVGRIRQHKLEHEVEGVLVVEGRHKSFRRAYTEKWTKKRGALIDEKTGHETVYYVDGVPTTKREYDTEVASIMPEELFKLLTNPAYFNEQLKWQDRRKLLLEICGDVTDAEVIHSNKELSPLESILQERDIDKHKAVLSERMKRINQDIKDIPVRISEAQRSMPELPEEGERFYRANIGEMQDIVAAKQEELARVRAGGQTAELQKRIAEIDSEQLRIKSELQTSIMDMVAKQRSEVDGLHRQINQVQRDIDDYQYSIQSNKQRISDLDARRERLRAEYATESAKQFEHTHDNNCPACGQALPDDRQQEAHDKALAEFNRYKSLALESIRQRGHTAKEESEKLTADNERLASEIDKLELRKESLKELLVTEENALERLRCEIKDPAHDERYIALQNERTALAKQIDALQADQSETISTIKSEIVDLQDGIAGLQVELAKFDQVERQQQRIAELEQQERKLAAEYEQAQHELFLLEEFTRTKVDMLQSRIDSKFKIARFRLFDKQINGGLRETCETLSDGVPYDKGLNNAARINVGLDIINTLSQHYGVSAPIFVDNAEAVTRLLETDAQVIRLIVSATDKKLRIVTTKSMQEAI